MNDISTTEAAVKLLAAIADRDDDITKTWCRICNAGPRGMNFALYILTRGGLAREVDANGVPCIELLDHHHRAVVLLTNFALDAARTGGARIVDIDGVEVDLTKETATDVRTLN